MAKRGRPKSPRAASAKIVRLTLRLYPGEDDDLIGFFLSIPTGLRAAMVKHALRSGADGGEGIPDPQDEEAVMDALDAFVS